EKLEVSTKVAEKEIRDFRLVLQSELVSRCRVNPRYSLRAFAKALKVSPSALSAMLSGKRTITDATKKRFAIALGLGPEEMARFQSSPQTRARNEELKKFQQL